MKDHNDSEAEVIEIPMPEGESPPADFIKHAFPLVGVPPMLDPSIVSRHDNKTFHESDLDHVVAESAAMDISEATKDWGYALKEGKQSIFTQSMISLASRTANEKLTQQVLGGIPAKFKHDSVDATKLRPLIRKFSKGQQLVPFSPIWMMHPSAVDLAYSAAETPLLRHNKTLAGYDVVLNDAMPRLAKGRLPCLFGDFHYLLYITCDAVKIRQTPPGFEIEYERAICYEYSNSSPTAILISIKAQPPARTLGKNTNPGI